jgi:hypothetical protein
VLHTSHVSDTELQIEFARRVRRHLIILPMALTAFAVPLGIGSFLKRITYGRDHLPHGFNTVIGLSIAALLLVTIGYALWSTVKNLRCPSCETNVWYMVSRNAGLVLLSDDAHTHCPKCEAEIVGPILRERTKRIVLITFVAGLLFSIVGFTIRATLGH